MNKIQKFVSVPILALSLTVPQGAKGIQPVVNTFNPIIHAVHEKMPPDALKLEYFCPEAQRIASVSKVLRDWAGKLGIQTFPGSEKLPLPLKRNPKESLGNKLSRWSKFLANTANQKESVYLTCGSANLTPGVKCMSEHDFARMIQQVKQVGQTPPRISQK